MKHGYDTEELIAALATPWGESALAVIRTSGTGSVEKIVSIFKGNKDITKLPGYSLAFGMLRDGDKAVTSVDSEEIERVNIKNTTLWLRIDADFTNHKDCASFSFSEDGKNFRKIGKDFRMRFDYRRFFMGTRFAIFNYATKKTGGYIDVDNFDIIVNDEISENR